VSYLVAEEKMTTDRGCPIAHLDLNLTLERVVHSEGAGRCGEGKGR